MSNLDLLKNDGVLVLNKPLSSPAEKTVIVLGIARGGTTMVASVLQALGVYMGDINPVLEDVKLSTAVESRNIDALKSIIAQRNLTYPIWGWKRPSAITYSDVWQDCFRNPHIIMIFRDPFAVANRNRISMLSDVFQTLDYSLRQLDALITFAKKEQNPILLCSYEKVLASPEFFVSAIDDFLDLKASENWANAVCQVNPESKEYLEASRITQSKGCLGIVNEHFCSGWAFYVKQPNRVAKIQIFVNDQIMYTVEAHLLRPDLKQNKIHPTGRCGFKFEWPTAFSPKIGDKIEARVEGDIKFLQNSPKHVVAT